MKTDAILERLTRLHPKVIDLSLGRLQRLLGRLGNPERRLPPVVHVAGTNGKGSVVAYMRAMAEAAGYRVHAYTSPHLVRFAERIRLAGRIIDEDELSAVLRSCERANGHDPITFFEITTAAAFLAFSERPADLLLLETGLGGRLDATNVVERPLVTAITPVSMDHMHYLGDSLGEIAAEKAGILKPGVVGVIGPQSAPAAEVIARQAAAVGAPLRHAGIDWEVGVSDGGMVWRAEGDELVLPRPALAGRHQLDNAGIAVAGLRALSGFSVPAEAIGAGLLAVEWPGRLERLAGGGVTGLLPGGSELWLDGGHNPAAGEALAAALAEWERRDAALAGHAVPVHLVVGMLNSKQPAEFLAPLAPHVVGARTVAIPGEGASLSAEEVAAGARLAGIAARPAATVSDALAAIADATRVGPAPRVLICGSLYLAGKVLSSDGLVTPRADTIRARAG